MNNDRQVERVLTIAMLIGAFILFGLAFLNLTSQGGDGSFLSPQAQTEEANTANLIKPRPQCDGLTLIDTQIGSGQIVVDRDFHLILGSTSADQFVITGNYNCVSGGVGDSCIDRGQGNVIVGMTCN